MKGSVLVVCCVVTFAGFAMTEAEAGPLAVDAGFGYRTWTRGDTTLARSYVQVVPSYQNGRWRLATPVQVAFRSAEGPFSFGNLLAFKSDDWVNLDVELSYALGRTWFTFQHDSLQLLSSGRLPQEGFGDVETENRMLVHRAVGQAAGARLAAVGGYWGMDRWTDEAHGQCRGPALGVELEPTGRNGWAPRALLLLGRDAGGSFGAGTLGACYRRGTWQVEANLEHRSFSGDGQSFFDQSDRRWNLAVIKGLR
jgi:hypothetical protein